MTDHKIFGLGIVRNSRKEVGMKTAVFVEPHKPLILEDRPVPKPGPHELLVRVRAVGICGSDIHASEEDWTPKNIVMGHEFSGEIAGLGSKVANWAIGDRVVPMPDLPCGVCDECQAERFERCVNPGSIGFNADHPGAYAEYLTVSAAHCLPLPSGLSFEDAAAVEPLAVGYDTVRRCELAANDRVLIIGAGPIGLSVAQWCRHFGVTDIAVSELSPDRLARAERMGANWLINASEVDDPAAEFERLTGQPPTIIVEAVGLPGMIQRCVDMAVKNTRIVVVGVCVGTDQFEPMTCIFKRLKLIFAYGYSLKDYATILKLMEQGHIVTAPLISHRIRLDELPNMFEKMRQPTDQIKVIVNP